MKKNKICKHFIKNKNGLCKYYNGDKELISGCKCNCDIYRTISNKKDKKSVKSQLEAQIVGIEVPYDFKK